MTLDRLSATKILEELTRQYLAREMSGKAYVRVAGLVIEISGLDEADPDFDAFRLTLASYSPLGGDELISDAELRQLLEKKLSRWPS
jgi:hypothetical protein